MYTDVLGLIAEQLYLLSDITGLVRFSRSCKKLSNVINNKYTTEQLMEKCVNKETNKLPSGAWHGRDIKFTLPTLSPEMGDYSAYGHFINDSCSIMSYTFVNLPQGRSVITEEHREGKENKRHGKFLLYFESANTIYTLIPFSIDFNHGSLDIQSLNNQQNEWTIQLIRYTPFDIQLFFPIINTYCTISSNFHVKDSVQCRVDVIQWKQYSNPKGLCFSSYTFWEDNKLVKVEFLYGLG